MLLKTTLTVIACAALVCAQDAPKKELPPAGGTPKPFSVPKKETFKLRNGMQVTLVPYGVAPVVTVSAKVAFGNANEGPNQVWLADFVGEMLSEGTASMTAEELAREAARMGGQLATSVGPDTADISIDVLSEFASDAVKLVADVLQRPRFPETEMERQRANFLRQLTVQLANPQGIASQAFFKQVYGDHPYGRLFPTEAMLKSYTIDDVRNFYKSNVGARRTHLFISGRFEPDVRKAIEAAFNGWAEGPEVQRNPPKTEAKRTFTLIDRPGAQQSTLRIGLPVAADPTSKDYIPFQVTNSLLGGSFASRITSNIREQKGYTYSPSSQLSSRYHTAHWVQNADVTTNVTAESIKEILYEVNRLRQEPPAEKELAGIKNYMSGIFVLQNSSPRGIIEQLNFVSVQGLSDDYLRTYVPKVNAVTRGDVQGIAERYLDPNKMTFVIVGDKAKIEQSLKPYAGSN